MYLLRIFTPITFVHTAVVVKKIFTWVYRIRVIIRIYQLFVGV